MTKLSTQERCPRHVRPRNELKAAEMHLEHIRKLVLKIKSRFRDAKPLGNSWDVLANIRCAIQLARFGQTANADDATIAADQVQIICYLIDRQIDQLIAQVERAR